MREIKFRAFVKGKMVPASILNNYRYCAITEELDFEDMRAVVTLLEDCPVMQFTGRKDKNGREIYEGDIRRGHYYCTGSSNQQTIINVMKWDEKTACFYWDGPEMEDWMDEGIIGSIYENPELLTSSPP